MLSPEVEPGTLTELDRFIFESWGYLIIQNVLRAEEVAACLAASRRIHAAAGTTGWGQVGRSYETEPALEQLIDHPGVLPKVRGILGDRFLLQSGWNTMQPAHGKMGRWHQDGSNAYDFAKLGYPTPLLQLRASFLLTDQGRPGMGNMELIPGSHRSAVRLPEVVRTDNGDPAISQVICAPAGAVLLFHNAVWHRAYEHEGEDDRFTMHMIYSPPWVRSSDRLVNAQEFLQRTTPLRRALMGEWGRPEEPFGNGYERPPFPE